jgi:SAM-dependent methyltransferase
MMRVRDSIKKFSEANREAWNEVIPRHQKAAGQKWDLVFRQPGFVHLDEVERDLLMRIGMKGKSVAQLCCNNGVELLTLKNLGAGECVGFDISDLAIREAAERAKICQMDCQYVRTDVYDIGPEYCDRFDMVYLSAGALGWMPDLKLFIEKAVALLRANGRLFIHEIHPLSEMLPTDYTEEDNVLRIIEPYFKAEPYVDYGGLDYVGGSQYASDKPQYWFVHTLSDILMALVENDIALEHFSEYPKDVSSSHRRVEESRAGVPLSYILIGRK